MTKKGPNKPRETDLYAPIKKFLQSQDYEVKGEVGAADIVAVRGDEDPLIVELKTTFSLSLFHQAIERQALTDTVYIAVPRGKGKPFRKSLANNKALCRRLGLGLITVRMRDKFVETHLDPAPYKPRQSKPKKARLLREFSKLVGDPNIGGLSRQALSGNGLITAYRQDALRCLNTLAQSGPLKAAIVAKSSSVPRARTIMADNHYGWFERIETGIYALSPKGQSATAQYATEVANISTRDDSAE